jgi:hypothetical protein
MKRPIPVWLLLLGLPLLWLAPMIPAVNSFPFAPGSPFSDLAITHWMNALVLHRSLAANAEIALWNPYILGGTPLAGDPLSGLYYPPLWLAAFFPEPWAFNLVFYAHLALAGCGAYALARAEGAGRSAALLAGVAFGGAAKFAAHIAAGHLTLVCATAWTPWLLLATKQIWRGGIRRAALAGALAGLIFLADPRWALPAAVAALAYACIDIRTQSFKRVALFGIVALLMAVGICAVLAMPMYTLTMASTRSALTVADNLALALPVRALLGLLTPQTGGSLEWVIYPGAIVILLAAQGGLDGIRDRRSELEEAAAPARRWRTRFWIGLLGFSILFTLGDATPVYPFMARVIPGFGLLRVPSRWMFLAALALAMLGARGWSAVESRQGLHAWTAKLFFGVAVAGASVALAAWQMRLPAALVMAGVIWCISALALWWALAFQPRAIWAAGAMLIILCADLGMASGGLMQPRSLTDLLASDGVVARQWAVLAQGYRVYSPSYNVPQHVSIYYEMRTLHGIAPLMLRSTQSTVLRAAGITAGDYSVTLPPFATGDPAADNRDAMPDAQAMGLLNVHYLVSSFPIAGAGWIPVESPAGSYLYEDAFAQARAWMANDMVSWRDPLERAGAFLEGETANSMRFRAEGPGVLIISEAAYPGWQATVDGAPAPMESAGGWWRAIPLGSGVHMVETSFSPPEQFLGLAITLLALAALMGIVRWAK